MKNIFWIVVITLVAGCSASRITTSWKSEKISGSQYKKILVLGLLHETNRAMREKMEDHLVGDLKDLGYEAVSSLKEYGPKTFDNINEQAAIDKIQNNGFDAVMTIVLLDKSQEKYYVPEKVYYSPYVIYQNHFHGYYRTMVERIYQPEYYVSTKYFWESNLYDVAGKLLLYSVQTESFDPASTERLGHEYGKMIVQDMVKNYVLNRQVAISLKTF